MHSHAARRRPWPRWGLYLLLSVAICAAPASSEHSDRSNYRKRSLLAASTSRYTKPYNVCTSDWAPMVVCAGMDTQAGYSGYQVALWREIAADLGWADSDWFFSCVDWTAMINDLVSPHGNCSFAAAGVEVSLENVLKGLQFSWPIYKSGFKVLISSIMEEGGTWAFAEAFHWTVWVVIGATSLVVGMLITVVEMLTPGDKANRKGLRGWSWYAMGKMVSMQTHVGDPKTWASRLMVLGYAFLALILVHLYTATTASKLTMQRLANDVKSKADLPGKKVESWTTYVPQLRKYSIDAAALPWNNDNDTNTMLNNLRTHTYQALVLDAPVVSYLAATASQCDLYPVGGLFETFNLAIAFPPDVPTDLAGNVSTSIVRMQTSRALMDTLDNIYVKGVADPSYKGVGAPTSVSARSCPSITDDTTGASHTADIQIKFDQVLGLWAIQAITLGIALVQTVIVVLVYKRRQKGAVAPAPGGVSNAAVNGPSTTDDHGMLLVEGVKAGSQAEAPVPHATCEVSLPDSVKRKLGPVASISATAETIPGSPLGKHQQQQHGFKHHPFATDGSFSAPPLRQQQQQELRESASLSPTAGHIRPQEQPALMLDSTGVGPFAGQHGETGGEIQDPDDGVLVLSTPGAPDRQQPNPKLDDTAKGMAGGASGTGEAAGDNVLVL